jgi:cell fate regulator YaaT (PSP1 superfamily)
MRQIGSRDEARLVGDYETCGLECCCKRFLKILKPVNMRMAKLQKATLDPSKISGHCGRLKCCLRYEDETYRELRDNLPKKNTRVKTAQGEGRVVDAQVLTQLVIIQADDGTEFAVPLAEITSIGDAPRQERPRPCACGGREGNDARCPAQEREAEENAVEPVPQEPIEQSQEEENGGSDATE